MQEERRINASVHWYLEELGARVVARSGRARDRHHLGRLVLRALRDAPQALCQIDGGTGESESNGAVCARSVRCARAMGGCGLRAGDVIAIAAPNHLHLAVPFYAALYAGVAVAPIDRTLTVDELKASLSICRPKIIFCQSEKAGDMQLALNQTELRAHIVTFDAADGLLTSLHTFLNRYADDTPQEQFECADLDPQQALAVLLPTSGTTGVPKYAAITHYNFAVTSPYIWCRYWRFPTPTRLQLVVSPLQWLTGVSALLTAALLRYPRLHSSRPPDAHHVAHLIHTYKPSYAILSPTLAGTLLAECDLSCLDALLLGGSAVPAALIGEIQSLAPRTEVAVVYGMTELSSIGLAPAAAPAPPGACGQPLPCYQYRLVNVETQEDITEPKVNGELWMTGPGVFKGYYNNESATAETFAPGGWLRTGDLFYRDERWNFYFVERIKLLLKYKSHHVSPVELEAVIRSHPGVLDAAVTGVPDAECGELPAALVVRRKGAGVTAADIEDLIKASLSESKRLRGGVVFVPALPLTASGKLHRRALGAALAAARAAVRAGDQGGE